MLHAPILVEFNAKDTNHRKHFQYFMTKSKWSPDAPRFALENPFVNVPLMIQHKLLEYYLTTEYKGIK